MINAWERWLDSLDTAGGHLVILFALVLVGVVMSQFGMMKGEDVQVGAFSALLMALKEVHSNYTRRNTPPAPLDGNGPRSEAR